MVTAAQHNQSHVCIIITVAQREPVSTPWFLFCFAFYLVVESAVGAETCENVDDGYQPQFGQASLVGDFAGEPIFPKKISPRQK